MSKCSSGHPCVCVCGDSVGDVLGLGVCVLTKSIQGDGDEPSICLSQQLVTTWYNHSTHGLEFKTFADSFWETYGNHSPQESDTPGAFFLCCMCWVEIVGCRVGVYGV